MRICFTCEFFVPFWIDRSRRRIYKIAKILAIIMTLTFSPLIDRSLTSSVQVPVKRMRILELAYKQSSYEDETWTLIYSHDFREGHAPNWSGWGDVQLVEEGVQLSSGTSYCGLYFFPVIHKNEWIMETMVKITTLVPTQEEYANVQLLTRDGPDVNSESGMILYCGITQGSARHMVDHVNYVYQAFPLPSTIELNTWYVMRFAFYNGTVECYVNGEKCFETDGNLTAHNGEYTQPHIAVFYGTAVFQNVKIYEPTMNNAPSHLPFIETPLGIATISSGIIAVTILTLIVSQKKKNLLFINVL